MSELVYDRRYQAWADRQAREAEQDGIPGDAEEVRSKKPRPAHPLL